MIPLTGGTSTVTLDTLTSVFQTILTWFTDFIGNIASNPLLLIGIASMVASIVIRLAYKALHGRG